MSNTSARRQRKPPGSQGSAQDGAAQQAKAAPDEPPDPTAGLFEDLEVPWWLTEEFCGSEEAEQAAWLAGLPDDVREEYERGPYTGDGEAIPPGFTHHDQDGRSGCGFASGGANDTALPGSALAKALQTAAGVPLTGGGRHAELGESELIGVLCGWRRLTSWAQAGEAAAARTLVRRREAQARERQSRHVSEHVDDEVAAALRLSSGQADRLLDIAAGLARIPEVHAALEAGRIDYAKACAFVDLLAGLSDDKAREIARKLLAGEAAGQTSGKLRRRLEREVFDADPEAAQKRMAEGRKLTRVDSWREPSGNSVLAGRELDPADVIAIDKQLTAMAEWLQSEGADGTIRQLRSAVFTALLAGRELSSLLPEDHLPPEPGVPADTPEPSDVPPETPNAADVPPDTPGAAGVPPDTSSAAGVPPDTPGATGTPGSGNSGWLKLAGTVNLTMPFSTWAGLTLRAGEVAGYGTADAGTCVGLAGLMGPGAHWCLTLTGPDGRAVAHGCARTAPPSGHQAISWAVGLRGTIDYLANGACAHVRRAAGHDPPRLLRHLVCIRQRTCSFPGCSRSAVRCDLDHTLAYDNGGITCECNISPLCRKHHKAKQTPGWRLEQPRPGHMTWHLPHQRSYQTVGEPYPV